jgi:hypothetical protein
MVTPKSGKNAGVLGRRAGAAAIVVRPAPGAELFGNSSESVRYLLSFDKAISGILDAEVALPAYVS